jgi:hypothetical protein
MFVFISQVAGKISTGRGALIIQGTVSCTSRRGRQLPCMKAYFLGGKSQDDIFVPSRERRYVLGRSISNLICYELGPS